MWKDPQKGKPSSRNGFGWINADDVIGPTATTSTDASPTSPRSTPSHAPPTRGPVVAQTVQTTVIEAEGQAQVVYDYAGAVCP